MKLKLFHKLFGTFMLTVLAMVILSALTMRLVAYKNFSSYVTKVELAQLDDMTAQLKALYEKDQSWEAIRQRGGLFRRLIETYLPESRRNAGPARVQRAEEASEEGSRFREPPEHQRPAHPPRRPEPPESAALDILLPDADQDPYPYDNGSFDLDLAPRDRPRPAQPPPPPPPHHSDPKGSLLIGPRLTLFDEKQRPIVGPGASVKGYALREIIVHDKIVGWLGLVHVDHLSHPLNVDFLRQQTKAFLLATFSFVALGGVISFLLSRHLLAPIQQLAKGTRDLAAFKFDTRLDVRTHDELGQLSDNFNAMAQTLMKYEQMNRQWISDISHELRTPVCVLLGEIEAMQDSVRTLNPTNLSSLHSEAIRLGHLINDLHLLSLADSQALLTRKYPVDPVAVLDESIALSHTRLQQAGITVERAGDKEQHPIVQGDKDRLVQLFSNLIENTIRYTDSPGVLKISHECSAGLLRLVFEDSSPGVPAEALDRLFERLYRVDRSRSRNLGGSGLGLSISKEIVSAHGGTISANDSTLGGVRITVELPIDSD